MVTQFWLGSAAGAFIPDLTDYRSRYHLLSQLNMIWTGRGGYTWWKLKTPTHLITLLHEYASLAQFPFVVEQKKKKTAPLVIDENWTLKFCSMNQLWIYNEVDISYIFTRKNKRILAKLINIWPKITIIVSFKLLLDLFDCFTIQWSWKVF